MTGNQKAMKLTYSVPKTKKKILCKFENLRHEGPHVGSDFFLI